MQDTLGNLGSGDEFSDEAFDEVFATFDKDGSGTIEKQEMVVFIKQLLGGNWLDSSAQQKEMRLRKPTIIKIWEFKLPCCIAQEVEAPSACTEDFGLGATRLQNVNIH